ncbi:MAG: glycosyltransferase family 39 protein, partial [Chloroflexota bacterium]
MTRMNRTPLIALLVVLLIALIGRGLLLASGSVSFHSDEAVVGLMARHILQGERPVFFYGQAYMGSLDTWLIAVGFKLLGDSVLTIRIVQSIMYLLIVGTGFAVAWRISSRVVVATVAALVLAVPNVLLAEYSTATLGGYNETLLLGNLLLFLGWSLTHEKRGSVWRWAALGLVAGIGWWTNGLIIAYVLPVGVLLWVELWRNERRKRAEPQRNEVQPVGRPGAKSGSFAAPNREDDEVRTGLRPVPTIFDGDGDTRARYIVSIQMYVLLIGIAAVFFLIGSAPWWAFNLQNDWAALHFYLPSTAPSQFAGTDIAPLPTDQRLIGLFLLGLPAVIGLRFPW